MKVHTRSFVFLFFALAALALAACGPSTVTPGPSAVCGDGIVDAGEDCDGPGAASCGGDQTCINCQCVGRDSNVTVSGELELPEPEPPVPVLPELSFGECGDGVVNTGEVCDGLRATSSGYPSLVCAWVCDDDGDCHTDCDIRLGCGPDEYCSNDCTQCIPRPDFCGDGTIQWRFEECEPEVCGPGTFGYTCEPNVGCDVGQYCDASCACVMPSLDLPDPDVPPLEPLCGNGICDQTIETCLTCVPDCGPCLPTSLTGDANPCEDAAKVETYPVYDCTYDFDNGVWTYYEGMRCYDENGAQVFDGRTSGPITTTEWRGNCPSIFDEGDEDDGGDDGGQQCDPQQQQC